MLIRVLLLLIGCVLGLAKTNLPEIQLASASGKNDTRPFSIKVLKMVCIDQPYNYTLLHTCKVKIARNQPAKLYLVLEILRPANALFMSYILNYKYNTYRPLLFDDSFNFCSFMSEQGSGINMLMNFMYKIASSQIKWLHKCPYVVSTFRICMYKPF